MLEGFVYILTVTYCFTRVVSLAPTMPGYCIFVKKYTDCSEVWIRMVLFFGVDLKLLPDFQCKNTISFKPFKTMYFGFWLESFKTCCYILIRNSLLIFIFITSIYRLYSLFSLQCRRKQVFYARWIFLWVFVLTWHQYILSNCHYIPLGLLPHKLGKWSD